MTPMDNPLDPARRQVLTLLERHTADGRLTLDEFTERSGRLLTVTSEAGLAELTADLPALGPPAPPPAVCWCCCPAPRRSR